MKEKRVTEREKVAERVKEKMKGRKLNERRREKWGTLERMEGM